MKQKRSTSKSNTKNNSGSKSVQKNLSLKQTLCRQMLQSNPTPKLPSTQPQPSIPNLLSTYSQKSPNTFLQTLTKLSQPLASIPTKISTLPQKQAQSLLTILSQILTQNNLPISADEQLVCYKWVEGLLRGGYRFDQEVLARFREDGDKEGEGEKEAEVLGVLGMLDLLIG